MNYLKFALRSRNTLKALATLGLSLIICVNYSSECLKIEDSFTLS